MNLGDKVRCLVTGYEGTVTSITSYLNGCKRLGVQARVGTDSKIPDAIYIDEPQAELVEAKSVPATPSAVGGPMSFTPKKAGM